MSFLRILNVVTDTVAISDLRIDFDLTQSNQHSTKEPATAEIKIYNLAPNTRKKLSVLNQSLTLNAGHIDNIPAPIFTGTLKEYREQNTQTEIISILTVEDRGGKGETDLYNKKMSLSFPPLVTAISVIGSIAGFAGVPLASIPLRDYIFMDGFCFVGVLADALDKVVIDTLDLDWFIQDNKLLVESSSVPSIGLPTVVSAGNGLIGSPEKFTEKENKKDVEKYRFKTLLNPRSFVGQSITVLSTVEPMPGIYKIENIRKYGSNYSTDFYNDYIVRAI